MKKVILAIIVIYSSLSVFAQGELKEWDTKDVEVSCNVEFFTYEGPYGTEDKISEPAIRYTLTVVNNGNTLIPNLGAMERGNYVNFIVDGEVNNPISLYNGLEVKGDYRIHPGDSDTYVWWIFQKDAYGNIHTAQWQYIDKYTEVVEVNARTKTTHVKK